MEMNPDAPSIASQLDRERLQNALRGPLHGLPVLIKGNMGTRDRMQTNAGSFALQDSVLPADSTIARKLREQGLIILGKANLTEWSQFRSSSPFHSWSAVFGQTYGAYCPRQCPGGSSGGSAVAVDLGLAWAALGTETSGSIISPSERNNIVGIKPTVGLTSRHLVVPVSEHQDTVGPMARTVKDAAMLLQTIVGVDPEDSYTAASPFHSCAPDYLAACRASGFAGKRIGVARNVIGECHQEISHTLQSFENALDVMAKAGATIVENTDFIEFRRWRKMRYNPVTRSDFTSNICTYLSKLEENSQDVHNIHDLRDFVRSHPGEDYPRRNTENWDTAIEGDMSNASANFSALYQQNVFLGGEGGITGALERHRLDAIVLPSTVAFLIPALVGTPIITVPLGATPDSWPVEEQLEWAEVERGPGIPFGISFLGRKWSEEVLIEISYAYEQLTDTRRALQRYISPEADLKDFISS
ncbi:hypothetical protein HIM_05909 [Hirsutella minnesotensis 3608]|uniref:Amidase domain-containing protein n=1 Tax=Hirsutella minnesotensis 3608 TaxID=1043627 RepID=A0A0F7ZZU6_9HYPO|nr:hypothetical protein HIM_05909 [Hirsutella minnesotensis 3608]